MILTSVVPPPEMVVNPLGSVIDRVSVLSALVDAGDMIPMV